VSVAAVLALDGLRSGALAIAGAGVAAGLVARVLTLRRHVAVASAAAILVMAAFLLSRPGVQARTLDLVRQAADRQLGHVASFGQGYKVLDQRFYSEGRLVIATMTADEAVRYLGRALVAFFVVPAPWQLTSATGLGFLPEQIVWYALLLLSVPGMVVGFRRDPLLTWIFVGYVAAAVAVIAPNSGNIGTLVRHRDALMPALAWLGAAGFVAVLTHVRSSRERRVHGVIDSPLQTRTV
jgi:hypothetical protein